MTELICFLFGIVVGLGCNLLAEKVPPSKCNGNCRQGRDCKCTSE